MMQFLDVIFYFYSLFIQPLWVGNIHLGSMFVSCQNITFFFKLGCLMLLTFLVLLQHSWLFKTFDHGKYFLISCWFHFNPTFIWGHGPDNDLWTENSPVHPRKQLADMEAKSKEKEDPLAGIPSFHDFTQSTSFHGVSYIFEGRFKFRK